MCDALTSIISIQSPANDHIEVTSTVFVKNNLYGNVMLQKKSGSGLELE